MRVPNSHTPEFGNGLCWGGKSVGCPRIQSVRMQSSRERSQVVGTTNCQCNTLVSFAGICSPVRHSLGCNCKVTLSRRAGMSSHITLSSLRTVMSYWSTSVLLLLYCIGRRAHCAEYRSNLHPQRKDVAWSHQCFLGPNVVRQRLAICGVFSTKACKDHTADVPTKKILKLSRDREPCVKLKLPLLSYSQFSLLTRVLVG